MATELGEFPFDDLISASEAKVLGVDINSIFFTEDVLLEADKKKTSKEKKKLCISSKRIFLISSQSKTPKIELNISLLSIKEISSPDETHIILIYMLDASEKTKSVRFEMTDNSSSASCNTIVAILSPMCAVLGTEVTRKRVNLVVSKKRSEEVLKAVEDNTNRVSQNRTHGNFSDIYLLLCDYLDITMHSDVAWDIENTYSAHGITKLSLSDFPKLSTRDMVPLIRSIEFCRSLDSISVDGIKLCPEVLDAIIHTCKNCNWLKELAITGAQGLKHDFITKLFQHGIALNSNSKIDTLDFSDNPSLEDKGIQQLTTHIGVIPLGLRKLSLNNTGITSSGYASLSKAFNKHSEMANTLWYLSLSRNHFSSASDFHTFLSYFNNTNNKIQELYLSETGAPLDQIFQALHTDHTLYLSVLDLSGNNKITVSSFKHHNPKSPAYKQFFSMTQTLRECNLSNCKLTPDIVEQILEGLNNNKYLYNLTLNLSQNDFSSGYKVWPQLVSTVKCLHSLDLSYTSLDDNYSSIFSGIFSSPYLKELNLSGNFRKNKSLTASTMAECLLNKDCQLKVLKLADCKLSDQTSFILRALIGNSTLHYLDISGNSMGHPCSQALAKMISNNDTLESIRYDDNSFTIDSMLLIAKALEYNYSITDMPLPLKDIVRIKKEHEKDKQLDSAVTKIESYLQRNHRPLQHHYIRSSGRKFLLQLINEKQTLIDKKLESLEQKLQGVSVIDASKSDQKFILAANQLVAKSGTLGMVFENLYSKKIEQEGLSNDIAISDITQTLKQEMIKKMEEVVSEMMDKLKYTFGDIIKPEVISSTSQTLNEIIQGKTGKKEDIQMTPDSSLVESKLLNLISEGVSSNLATKHLDLARQLITIVTDYINTQLEETETKLDKLNSDSLLSPGATPPLSPEARVHSASTTRFKLAFTSSMKRDRLSYIATPLPFDVEDDPECENVIGSDDPLPSAVDSESSISDPLNSNTDVDLVNNRDVSDSEPKIILNNDDKTDDEIIVIPVIITSDTTNTTTSSSITPPPSPHTASNAETTPSGSDITNTTTSSSISSTPTTNSASPIASSTSPEEAKEDTIQAAPSENSEMENKEFAELERKSSAKKTLISKSKGIFGRSKKETPKELKPAKELERKNSKKDKKDTKPVVIQPNSNSPEVVKSKPETEVDFLNIDEISNNATQIPDISILRDKPKGPSRRPPKRTPITQPSSNETKPDFDVFNNLVSQAPSSFNAVISRQESPKRLDIAYAKSVGVKRMSVMIDSTADYTGADPLNSGTQQPPITSRKPKVNLFPQSNLAFVMESGLLKSKLRNARSSENLFDDLEKEESKAKENAAKPSNPPAFSPSPLRKPLPANISKKPILTPEKAPRPFKPDIQDRPIKSGLATTSKNNDAKERPTTETNTSEKIQPDTSPISSDKSSSNNDNAPLKSSGEANSNGNNTPTKNIEKTPIKPTDSPVKPTDSHVKPIDSPIKPTDSPVKPTDSPVKITDSHVKPTDSPVKPTDIAVKPTDSPIKPTDIPVKPTDIAVKPTDIPVKPTDIPVKPTDIPVKPTDIPVKPTDSPVKPTDIAVKPIDSPVKPTDIPVKPTDSPVKPTDIPVKPTDIPVKPTDSPVKPTKPKYSDSDTSPIKPPTSIKPTSPVKGFKKSLPSPIKESKKFEEILDDKFELIGEDDKLLDDTFSPEIINKSDLDDVTTEASSSNSLQDLFIKSEDNCSDHNNDNSRSKRCASHSDTVEIHKPITKPRSIFESNDIILKTKDETGSLPQNSPLKPKFVTPKPLASGIHTAPPSSPRRHTAIGIKPKTDLKKTVVSPFKSAELSGSNSDSSQKSLTPTNVTSHPLLDNYDAKSNSSESPEKQVDPAET